MTFRQLSGSPLVWIREMSIERVNKHLDVLCVVINSVGKREKQLVKHVSLKNAVG